MINEPIPSDRSIGTAYYNLSFGYAMSGEKNYDDSFET